MKVKKVIELFYTGYVLSSEEITEYLLDNKYLKHLVLANKSPNYIREMAYKLKYYEEYLQIKKLSKDEVLQLSYSKQYAHFTGYLLWLRAGNHSCRKKKPNAKTCNAYLEAVFLFYFFILKEAPKEGRDIRVCTESKVTSVGNVGLRFSRCVASFGGYYETEPSRGKTINKDKLEELIIACNGCLRSILLILLMAETGFRIGEILGIRWKHDIDIEKRLITVRRRTTNTNGALAKRGEFRSARISDETFELLMTYIAQNNEIFERTEYLFITFHGPTKGEALTVEAVYSLFRTLEKRTGIHVTPHMIRHYFANSRRKAGWDISEISAALGHRHRSTTEAYLNVDDEELIEASEKYYAHTDSMMSIDKLL